MFLYQTLQCEQGAAMWIDNSLPNHGSQFLFLLLNFSSVISQASSSHASVFRKIHKPVISTMLHAYLSCLVFLSRPLSSCTLSCVNKSSAFVSSVIDADFMPVFISGIQLNRTLGPAWQRRQKGNLDLISHPHLYPHRPQPQPSKLIIWIWIGV